MDRNVMKPGAVCALLAAVVLGSGCAGMSAAMAPGEPVLPVLAGSPACEQDRLGSVDVEVGTQVGKNYAGRPPTTSYAEAFEDLALAAQAKGGDAVVLRRHQAVFFTRMGERSRDPVFISVRGAVIDMQQAGQCELTLADAAQLQSAARGGQTREVDARGAYGD